MQRGRRSLAIDMLYTGIDAIPRYDTVAIGCGTDDDKGASLGRQLVDDATELNFTAPLRTLMADAGTSGLTVTPVPLSGPIDISRMYVTKLDAQIDAAVTSTTQRELLDLLAIRVLFRLHCLPCPFSAVNDAMIAARPGAFPH